jgi:uncharacterized membrane protein YeaQ/YmgE (transglycosylase-associated protein family)
MEKTSMEAILDTIQWFISAPFILLGWLIIGVIAGDLARRFMGSEDQGCLSDWLLGVLGAIFGGIVAGMLGFSEPDGGLGLVVVNLAVATAGAAGLIALRRALS